MRKVLSLVLALSMVLGMFSFAFAAELSDIKGEYYEGAVDALVELGVVNGYTDGTYKPNQVVTRAELAKMLVICLGQEQAAKIAKGSTQFSDVEADSWASGYINVAAQSKIIVGYPDGTFAPDATVTYAEAVTMALRALGYKNVVESAGTWPTNYITKANELQLLRDMKGVDAEDGAKRGNVAILLWNMLRTEMWDIDSENQTNGMTYRKTEEPMLNIKFPDYDYEDDAIFVSYDVDGVKVTAVVEVDGIQGEAELRGGDLLRLVPGMKVAFLYNAKDEVFLTMTPMDTLVEGRVDDNAKLDGKEYKDDNGDNALLGYEEAYVVVLLDGKKAVSVVVLPDGGREIDGDNYTLKKAQKDMDEDTLVIIEGEWANGEGLKEGDVVTVIDAHPANTGDEFYVVARNRVEGTFESITTETDKDGWRGFVEIDGDEYDAPAQPVIYEYNEKNEEYDEVDFNALFLKKDNKYLDEDVEAALNYLGDVINLYFGELKDEDDKDIRFYVVTGEHSWFESSKSGVKYYADLTDVNGDEDTHTLTAELGLGLLQGEMVQGGLYKALTNVYQQAAHLDDDDDTNDDRDAGELAIRQIIMNINNGIIMVANLNDKDELEFANAADVAEVYFIDRVTVADDEEVLDDDNYIDTDYKVTSSTKVIKITPVLDDDEVVGLEVEVLSGPKALDGVTDAIYVVDVDDDGNPKIKVNYVFVAEDARSSELNFGLVEKFGTRKGINTITISGTRYDLSDDSADAEIGNLVSFRVNDGEATIREVLKPTDLDTGKAPVVTSVEDEIVYIDEVPFDTETEAIKDQYKKHTFVVGTASLDKDDFIEFDSDVDVLGDGIESASFKKDDRVVVGKVDKIVVIIRGLKLTDDEVIDGGQVVDAI